MPRLWAILRARRTASGEQHARSSTAEGSLQSLRVTPTTRYPWFLSSMAATALSTPPLIPTSTPLSSGRISGDDTAHGRRPTALPKAACSASKAIAADARCAGVKLEAFADGLLPQSGGLEQRPALDPGDRLTRTGDRRRTAVSLEASSHHVPLVQGQLRSAPEPRRRRCRLRRQRRPSAAGPCPRRSAAELRSRSLFTAPVLPGL